MSTRGLPLALALAALALSATPASAGLVIPKTAKFKAKLRGTQLESSSVPADPASGCPAVQTRENLGFSARAPFKVELSYLGKELFVGNTGRVKVSTTGSVTREKNAVACGDKDDRDKPLDCGIRHFPKWELDLQTGGLRDLNLIEGPLERTDPFDNCTPFGDHFPVLMGAGEKPIVGHLSKRRILDRHKKTIVVTAHGNVTERLTDGGSTRNSLSWTLTLRRR
jgi:hypothetical protein